MSELTDDVMSPAEKSGVRVWPITLLREVTCNGQIV